MPRNPRTSGDPAAARARQCTQDMDELDLGTASAAAITRAVSRAAGTGRGTWLMRDGWKVAAIVAPTELRNGAANDSRAQAAHGQDQARIALILAAGVPLTGRQRAVLGARAEPEARSWARVADRTGLSKGQAFSCWWSLLRREDVQQALARQGRPARSW